jgi:hypothetical protein
MPRLPLTRDLVDELEQAIHDGDTVRAVVLIDEVPARYRTALAEHLIVRALESELEFDRFDRATLRR